MTKPTELDLLFEQFRATFAPEEPTIQSEYSRSVKSSDFLLEFDSPNLTAPWDYTIGATEKQLRLAAIDRYESEQHNVKPRIHDDELTGPVCRTAERQYLKNGFAKALRRHNGNREAAVAEVNRTLEILGYTGPRFRSDLTEATKWQKAAMSALAFYAAGGTTVYVADRPNVQRYLLQSAKTAGKAAADLAGADGMRRVNPNEPIRPDERPQVPMRSTDAPPPVQVKPRTTEHEALLRSQQHKRAVEFRREWAHLTLTIFGEARGEDELAMQAVANVVMNRKKQGRWGDSVYEVVTKRQRNKEGVMVWQFSCWGDGNKRSMNRVYDMDQAYSELLDNDPYAAELFYEDNKNDKDWIAFRRAKQIAYLALTNRLGDVTGGANHYHATYVDPWWADHMTRTTEEPIGKHIFYRD